MRMIGAKTRCCSKCSLSVSDKDYDKTGFATLATKKAVQCNAAAAGFVTVRHSNFLMNKWSNSMSKSNQIVDVGRGCP